MDMNNVSFYKGKNGDNWIYLDVNGNGIDGIKVFYDDGSLKNSKLDMATYYENYMKDIAGKNNLAAIEYFVSSVDLCIL